MKKMMKKVLCLALALAMVLSLAACAGGEAGKAKKTAEDFMNAMLDLNLKEAKSFLDDDSVFDELDGIDVLDGKALMDVALADVPAEMASYMTDLEPALDKVIDKMKKSMSYKLGKPEKDGDKYSITLTYTGPDEDKNPMESVITEDALTTLVQDLITTGKITQTMTEEEMITVLMGAYVDFLDKAIDDMKIETKDYEQTIVVKEDDGKWIIDTENSDLEKIIGSID